MTPGMACNCRSNARGSLMAPRGTPAEVRERLASELAKILAKPETTKKLLDLGFDAAPPMSPQQVTEWIRAEREKFGALIRKTGMKAN